MSIASDAKLKELERKVKQLEDLIATMISEQANPKEPALDKRTREYKEWKIANSSH